jgi:hypothetical protein
MVGRTYAKNVVERLIHLLRTTPHGELHTQLLYVIDCLTLKSYDVLLETLLPDLGELLHEGVELTYVLEILGNMVAISRSFCEAVCGIDGLVDVIGTVMETGSVSEREAATYLISNIFFTGDWQAIALMCVPGVFVAMFEMMELENVKMNEVILWGFAKALHSEKETGSTVLHEVLARSEYRAVIEAFGMSPHVELSAVSQTVLANLES